MNKIFLKDFSIKKALLVSSLCLALTACGDATPPVATIPLMTPSEVLSPSLVSSSTPTASNSSLLAWHIPILMFHHIGDIPANADKIRIGLTVSTATFANDLSILQKKHYHPITFSTLESYLTQHQPLPDKPIMITLDDGYDDNYTNAFPALTKEHFPAIFYIITDKVGTEGYMTWEQVKDLKQSGQEIGSHTRSHPDLEVISVYPNRLKDELATAKSILEAHGLGPILSLAYPSGKFNAAVEAVARKNYDFSRTTKPGIFTPASIRTAIPDIRVMENSNLDKLLP